MAVGGREGEEDGEGHFWLFWGLGLMFGFGFEVVRVWHGG